MENELLTFDSLRRAPESKLETLMRSGRRPEGLADTDWRGWNVGFLPGVLGIRKFIKVFRDGPGGLHGWNLVVRQRGGDTWVPVPAPAAATATGAGALKRGFYRLVEPGTRYPNSLLIDYGGRNPALDPAGLLRDYLVQLGPDVLLGKAYTALGPLRVKASYFVLGRLPKDPDRHPGDPA